MPAIFISYRRADSAGHAGRLYDTLCARFGAERVFMDVDDIAPGEDFVRKLDETERVCSALLVIIGKTWLSARIREPEDFVRREIAGGLSANLRVFPVLVQGACMPHFADLPDDIAALAHLQALSIRDDHFQTDMAELLAVLSPLLTTPSPTWVGSWRATVKYNWGVSHDEIFQFEMDDDELLGTASYLGTPRAITEGKITDKKISFVTKSLTILGDKTYEEKHSYSGKLVDGQIAFRLLTETGYDTRLPETFTAVRC